MRGTQGNLLLCGNRKCDVKGMKKRRKRGRMVFDAACEYHLEAEYFPRLLPLTVVKWTNEVTRLLELASRQMASLEEASMTPPKNKSPKSLKEIQAKWH